MSRPDRRDIENSDETLTEALAADFDESPEEIERQAEQMTIEDPWNADVVEKSGILDRIRAFFSRLL